MQEEYEEVLLKSGAKGVHSLIAQAKEFETQGEYQRAVQCYLKVKETSDADLIITALLKVELTSH